MEREPSLKGLIPPERSTSYLRETQVGARALCGDDLARRPDFQGVWHNKSRNSDSIVGGELQSVRDGYDLFQPRVRFPERKQQRPVFGASVRHGGRRGGRDQE